MASPAPAPTLPPPPPLPENGTNPPPLSTPIGSPPPVSIPSPSLPSTSVLPPLLPPSVDMMPPVDIVNPPFTGSETLNSPINSLSPLEATSPSPVSLVSSVTLPKPPIPSFSLPSPPPPLTKILIPPITSPPPPPLTELPYPSPSLKSPSVPLSSPPPPSITQVNARGISVQALNRFNLSTGLIAGISVSGMLLLVLLGVCCFCCMKRRKKKDNYYASLAQQKQKKCSLKRDHVINVPPKPLSYPPLLNSDGGSNSNDSGFENPLSPQGPGIALGYSSCIFTYEDLVVATNGFSEANLLGQGGFGYVHKGILSDGREIAVKKLKPGSSQGEREFQAEVETISRVHHKHLVSLVGYCCAGVERLLVYEFVPNNTLEFRLHGKEQTVMKWATRLKIAIGSAKGLAYLHEYCNPTVIHRDIKSSNILIDNQFEAKVSDFGLAKFFSDTGHLITHISTRVVGTFGYLDPEYANCGKVTDKSDVFSFGVVLLELVTGRVPINTTQSCTHQSLFEWARPLLKQALEDQNFDALVDPRLQKSYEMNEMASMVACAAACVRQSAWLRPRMSQIVRVLEGDISFSVLNEGTRPGESAICGPIIDLKNLEDMNKWSTRDFGTSDSCEKASDHGLNPSGSSTDDTHKIPVRQDKKDK